MAYTRLKQTCREHSHTNFRCLDNIVNLKEFEAFCKFEDDSRPIFIVIVDIGVVKGCQKVIQSGVCHFVKFDLDALFIATNAPGRSAFNRIERRIAPLSGELGGLIWPLENYGSYLD